MILFLHRIRTILEEIYCINLQENFINCRKHSRKHAFVKGILCFLIFALFFTQRDQNNQFFYSNVVLSPAFHFLNNNLAQFEKWLWCSLIWITFFFLIFFIVSDWGPWSACSVTCGIGVRYRTTECDSSNPLPGEKQTKVEESCTVKPSCPQGITNVIYILLGLTN